jgi:hypothetical protein
VKSDLIITEDPQLSLVEFIEGRSRNDGAVGIALFLGGQTMPNRAVVQIGGGAFRMKIATLNEEFARGGPLQHLLLRYTQSLLSQISQTAVCNRLHSVESRLCRWLLLSQDRVKSNEVRMTQWALRGTSSVRANREILWHTVSPTRRRYGL